MKQINVGGKLGIYASKDENLTDKEYIYTNNSIKGHPLPSTSYGHHQRAPSYGAHLRLCQSWEVGDQKIWLRPVSLETIKSIRSF